VHNIFLEEVKIIQNQRQQFYQNNQNNNNIKLNIQKQNKINLQQYAEITMITNKQIERIFYTFWTEFLLRAIPRNIQHFSGSKVIACNIQAVLTELLITVAVTSLHDAYIRDDMIDDVFHSMNLRDDNISNDDYLNTLPSATMISRAASMRAAAATTTVEQYNGPESSYISKVNRKLYDSLYDMNFEEFLATFIQEVATYGESNICYAFYKEFVADGSSVFKNFLLRHSKVIENWSI